jgi:hypothetical protein
MAEAEEKNDAAMLALEVRGGSGKRRMPNAVGFLGGVSRLKAGAPYPACFWGRDGGLLAAGNVMRIAPKL